MRSLLIEPESLNVLKFLALNVAVQERLTSPDKNKQLPAKPVKGQVKFKVRTLI
jgi:hypothetical protein